LWYSGPNAVENAIGYALHRSSANDAVIRVYDAAGKTIETHEHKGDFKRMVRVLAILPPFK
jgi:glutamate formiminotransferase